MEQVKEPPLITASQLWQLILTEPLAITTLTFCDSLRPGTDGQCLTQATLILDFRSTDSWGRPSLLTDSANSLFGRVGSNVVHLSILELESLLFDYDVWGQRYGFVQRDLISDWITSIPTPDIGSDVIASSSMRSFGANISTGLSLEPLGLRGLLLFWMTCLTCAYRPEELALKLTSETSLTIEPQRFQRESVGLQVWKMLHNDFPMM